MTRKQFDIQEKTMKVSFDFDSTLSRPSIQEYARELVDRGIEVWITTSRYGDQKSFGMHIDNSDLFAISDELGIKRRNIIFTYMVNKYHYIQYHGFAFHLDDDFTELIGINGWCNGTVGISCWNNSSWKKKCEKAIERTQKI